MKKSLIWTTAGIAVIGISGPVFAAHRADDRPVVSTPASTVVASTTPASNSVQPVTVNSVEDRTSNSVTDDSVTDDSVTSSSVDDNGVDDNGVDDNTVTTVEDISGPCDEAEHANDPSCTGVAGTDDSATSSTDDSGRNHAEDGAQFRVEHLERDATVVLEVTREIDGRHPATPNLALDVISIGERLQKSLWRPEAPTGATDENGVSAFDQLGGLDGGQDNRLALHGTSEPRIVAGYLLAQGAARSIWAAREMREASAYGRPTS